MAEGKAPNMNKIIQVGGGHLGKRSNIKYAASVGRQCYTAHSPVIQDVTPATQSVERAKAEIQREDLKNQAAASLQRRAIKRKRHLQSASTQETHRAGKKVKKDIFD